MNPISIYSQESCCFWKVGKASHASRPMKKIWRNRGRFCRQNIQQMSLFAHVFKLHFWDPRWFHVISQTFACIWFKQGFFCHSLFGLIKCPFQSQMIQLEEPSTTWNHMCMNLRMVRMPQVLDPILRWRLVKLLQLSFLWLCQVASSQLQASVCIMLFAIMAKELKWRP